MSVNKKPIKHIDFTPDEIISSEVFHGRFFVCTRNAVWEIFEDKDVLCRKLIAHT